MSWLIANNVAERVARLDLPFNSHGLDPFGISKSDLKRLLSILSWAYKNYFRMRVSGISHIPTQGRAMLVGNHAGGVAVDASMVIASIFLEMNPPRLAHGMAEKFLSQIPFISPLLQRCGQLAGLPQHALQLLEKDRILLVFPEGVHGTAKLYGDRNSLVDFGSGFIRLALRTKSPIIPFAFLGGGDAIPTVVNLYAVAKLFGAPYLPITPYLVPFPRPVALEIYYSEPMYFDGNGDEDDDVIIGYVSAVRARITTLLEQGDAIRRGRKAQSYSSCPKKY